MKFRKLKTVLVGLATLAAGFVVAAPGAHAAGCGSDRVLASTPTTVKDSLNRSIGQLYLGYIPSCRMMYAELHTFNVNETANSASIWIENGPAGTHAAQAGKVYSGDVFSGGNLHFWGGYFTSNLVPIDQFGYRYAMPHLYADWMTWDTVSGLIPTCLTNHDWHGNWHNFATGYNDSSHSSERC
ncbi:hypothetical protein ABIA33_005041 [Streptacidiphilus sp. MAP12-16]|uniref:hypothetical protein n=1 Tax=Streptacidiphilus sp. MAP12-16 TaxID=3156300 RepID=UPI003518BA85